MIKEWHLSAIVLNLIISRRGYGDIYGILWIILEPNISYWDKYEHKWNVIWYVFLWYVKHQILDPVIGGPHKWDHWLKSRGFPNLSTILFFCFLAILNAQIMFWGILESDQLFYCRSDKQIIFHFLLTQLYYTLKIRALILPCCIVELVYPSLC